MKLNINHKNLLDIINLHYKIYYPIKSFVSKEEIGMYIRAECDNLHSQFQKENGMS
jgi:hypothetical protein